MTLNNNNNIDIVDNNNNKLTFSNDSNNSGKQGYNHIECLMKQSRVDLNTPIDTIDVSNTQYQIPIKMIRSRRDLIVFQQSNSYDQLLKFILQLSISVQGLDNNSNVYHSDNVNKLIQLINQLDKYIDEIPPKAKRTRFGNESFVEWFDKCQIEIPNLLKDMLEDQLNSQSNEIGLNEELSIYLINSFGDRTRIDYGSGHELNFICLLYGLVKVGYLDGKDYGALVLGVFGRYMKLMRRLQSEYWLEPAGSHGVWGLDDYHFLAFLFGSSQLIEHRYIKPKSIRNEETVASFAPSYMYLACILFIVRAKTGSLVEHSPMLVDISGVRTWAKVNEGMVKMYRNELLGKLPVMQHCFFGSLLPFQDDPSIQDDTTPEPRQLHVHSFSTCGCISRVPSMFAVESDRKDLNLLDIVKDDNNEDHKDCNDHTHNHNHNHHNNNSIPFD